ncbi:hypothetical protein Sjap_019556 [Stephania japonica]|uniref:Uncharacterized protein n=1 Tax=Stephania japonica TaxID=461633 RepID=A0AAP0F4H6_9MAGN
MDSGVYRVNDRTTEQTDGRVDRVDNRSTAGRTRSGFVFSGGILGFLFPRNATTLSTGVLYSSGLLALSIPLA